MRIEHIGYMMREPVKAAEWYVKNLGLVVTREGPPPAYARFLSDTGKHSMIEIYNNPKAKVPDYKSMDPLILHLAFQTDDVDGMKKKLIAAGATSCEDTYKTDAGDTIAVVRDPWGFPVQMVKRAKPML